jgi:hypothetical protein
MKDPLISNEVLRKNRLLGRILTALALVIAIGTYVGLGITHFNPFDKPPINQTGGM